MSSLLPIQDLLKRYYALEFHDNPQLAARLSIIQAWQKNRMEHTHAELFAVPEHQLMTEYFLGRLYGGPDFDVLAGQFERVLTKAKKIEGFVPSSTVRTGCEGIELAVLAIELDQQLAKLMDDDLVFDDHEDLSDDIIIQLYEKADQAKARYHQLDLLDKLARSLDKYVRSFVVQSAFKLAKGAAMRHHFEPMYKFLDEGFAAMKPLKSAEAFVGIFTQSEREIIGHVHAGNPDPFSRQNKASTNTSST